MARGAPEEREFRILVPALEQAIPITVYLPKKVSEKKSLAKICNVAGKHVSSERRGA